MENIWKNKITLILQLWLRGSDGCNLVSDEVDYDKLLNENVQKQENAKGNDKEIEVLCAEKNENEANCRCLRHSSNTNSMYSGINITKTLFTY